MCWFSANKEIVKTLDNGLFLLYLCGLDYIIKL